jgi:crossover junction endodeoxyribonuclease RusA
MIRFFVPSLPKPGGSKRAFMRPGMKFPVIVDDCANRDWKNAVRFAANEAMAGKPLFTGALEVTVCFVMPRPKAHYRGGAFADTLKENAPVCHTNAPDVLKLMRSTEDAMTNVVWQDDKANVLMTLAKIYGEKPGAFVVVEELDQEKILAMLQEFQMIWDERAPA